MPKYITLTEKQKEIIQWLNNPCYTVEHLQEWINRNDNVFINAPAALIATEAKGFFDAVCAIDRAGVAPVVHGRWVNKEYGFAQCNLCGQCHEVDFTSHSYCPNCGAKMDLE